MRHNRHPFTLSALRDNQPKAIWGQLWPLWCLECLSRNTCLASFVQGLHPCWCLKPCSMDRLSLHSAQYPHRPLESCQRSLHTWDQNVPPWAGLLTNCPVFLWCSSLFFYTTLKREVKYTNCNIYHVGHFSIHPSAIWDSHNAMYEILATISSQNLSSPKAEQRFSVTQLLVLPPSMPGSSPWLLVSVDCYCL